MSGLTPDGTAEPVSRDQILRRERGQGIIHFPCSADPKQDWQLYPIDPYSTESADYTYNQAGFYKHLKTMNLEGKRDRSSAYVKDENGVLPRDVERIRER